MKEDIIQMARQAGYSHSEATDLDFERLKRFAEIAMLGKREACCKAIDDIDDGEAPEYRACQEAIRARSEKMKEPLAIPSMMYAVRSNMDAAPSKIDAVPASLKLQAQIEAMVLSTVRKKSASWIGLDFDEIEDCFVDGYSTEENGILVSAQWLHDFAYAIEAKLKEKNT